uniref:RNA-dependent RNA polymerase n=1 Tax=Botrytis cinerea mycovirus 5 TaxID=2735930 RepID=A0A858YBM4_9VIRU|nr:RNA-dependent RNA polymerase [Botrytis cinerea mycovirus 5]
MSQHSESVSGRIRSPLSSESVPLPIGRGRPTTPERLHMPFEPDATGSRAPSIAGVLSSSPSRSPPASLARARAAKRRWEEDSADDLEIGEQGSVATSVDSRASYNTRRQRAWRGNHKASLRASARLRHKPVFEHIRVDVVDDFHRHYRPGFSFAPPDPLIEQFTKENGAPTPACNPDALCFMTPCDDVQMNHLKHFDRPVRTLNAKYDKEYQIALTAVSQMVRLDEKLAFPHSEDLQDVRYKARKFPGAHYRRLGYATRGEAQEQAVIDAKIAFAQLLDGEDVEPHTVRLGGRGKAVSQSQAAAKAAGVPKGRLILMLSQRDLLLCGVTEQLLTNAYCGDDYPVSLGMGWFKGNVRKFSERYAGFEKYFCFDAAKFDSSLDDYMIRDVVNILRLQFEDGMNDKYDAYWEFVIQSLIYAPIQRDDGWVMFKNVGTTSGHNHNTLIQSLCSLVIAYTNYLALNTGASPQEVVNDAAVETLGDDNLTASAGLLKNTTVEDVADKAKEIFGQDYSGTKSFATYSLMDVWDEEEPFSEEGKFQGVQYLGKFLRGHKLTIGDRKITVALPYRPCEETFTHMYYPERKSEGVERTYQRALGNLLDNYGNPLMAEWLNKLLDWLEPQMDLLPEDWLDDTVQDAARNYTSDLVRVPRPVRWTFEEWVHLCLSEDDSDPEWYMYA